MGLNYPDNLAAWQSWQNRRNITRILKHRVSTVVDRLRGRSVPSPADLVLHLRGERPRVLTALEGTTPTKIAALVRPLEFLPEIDLAVLAPSDLCSLLPGNGWRTVTVPPTSAALNLPETGEVKEVLGVGNYLPVGSVAEAWAREHGIRFSVIQHGLLAPQAPPLPYAARLFAFTEQDGQFWASGRRDIEIVPVGSDLLWKAAQNPVRDPESAAQRTPVYLGQLHGAESSRVLMALSTYRFCRHVGAIYRPHPGEKDLLSRVIHAWWKRRGIIVDSTSVPLTELDAPVVSAFSTGVVEAAARGLNSWVHHDAPPAWMRQFWDRYGLSTWGQHPTPVPEIPTIEPARRIADMLRITCNPEEDQK